MSEFGEKLYDFLEMNWKFSYNGKSIIEFNNNARDQEVTISKRQLFAFLKIINMSNPNISNSHYNIGSWLLGFDSGNLTDDFLQTTQENSDQKEGLSQ